MAPHPSRPGRAIALVVALLAITFAACGNDDNSATPASTTAVAKHPATSTTTRGTAASADDSTASADVVVKANRFVPATITVPVGTTVTWHFEDGATPHNVAFPTMTSPTLKSGTWSYRFTQAGTFSYKCTIHPFMAGTITVS